MKVKLGGRQKSVHICSMNAGDVFVLEGEAYIKTTGMGSGSVRLSDGMTATWEATVRAIVKPEAVLLLDGETVGGGSDE